MPTIDLTNLGPEALFVLAALVIVAKLAERSLDILQEVVKGKLASRNGRSKNGSSPTADFKKLAKCIEETADWHRTEGPGLVRIMNATADQLRASTSVLELIERRLEDVHANVREIQRAVITKL